MVSIFDVAKEAGVSKSTVSRVLNNESGVKENTRLAVEAAIRKLKYSPSYFAQGIRTGKTKTIAMMVPEYTNVFYNEMFRGVEDIALKHGYLVIICNTERHTKSEVEYTKELLNRNIDGIIYNTYAMDEDIIGFLKDVSLKLPVVFMNRIFSDEDNSYVVTDGFNGTKKAVEYLYSIGKRKIGYVCNMEGISVTEDRYQGYLQGMMDCGMEINQEFIYHIQQVPEPDYISLGREAAKYYTSLKVKPDAILTAIDMLALGCVQQFKREKIKVPEDINVIGFDNIALSELMEPTLTTIAQPIRKLGQKAAEIVIAKINGEDVQDRIVYEGELILRETTDQY